jgi:hypothetical protein
MNDWLVRPQLGNDLRLDDSNWTMGPWQSILGEFGEIHNRKAERRWITMKLWTVNVRKSIWMPFSQLCVWLTETCSSVVDNVDFRYAALHWFAFFYGFDEPIVNSQNCETQIEIGDRCVAGVCAIRLNVTHWQFFHGFPLQKGNLYFCGCESHWPFIECDAGDRSN